VLTGLAERCVRVLVEPLNDDPEEAVAHAAAMEQVLAGAGVTLEQVHHGDGLSSWSVSARAWARARHPDGVEDTTVLPDGRRASDNAALVRAAAAMML